MQIVVDPDPSRVSLKSGPRFYQSVADYLAGGHLVFVGDMSKHQAHYARKRLEALTGRAIDQMSASLDGKTGYQFKVRNKRHSKH